MSDLNEQLAALKAAAEAATPGPWAVGETYVDVEDGAPASPETVVRGLGGRAAVAVCLDFGQNNPSMRDANAGFVASANPVTILALIAEVEAARLAPAAAPAPVAAIKTWQERYAALGTAPNPTVEEKRKGACRDAEISELRAALAAAPAAAPIVQPPVELSPRQFDDENEPGGYLECDREFFERNAKLARWYLEHDATIRAALAAPVVQAEPVATVIKRGADRQWMSERMGDLPDGTYSLYLAAPTAAAADEGAFVIQRMGELLARIAVAVRGQEPALRRWSYHDLPERVEKLVLEVELHRVKESDAATAADAKDAARYRWLLENYARNDGYTEIDAALNDGEADKYLSPAIDAAIATSADEVKS